MKVDATSNLGGLALIEQVGVEKLRNPDRVSMVEDHQAPPQTVEVGGKLAVFECDEKTDEWLKE
jgi:homoaconitase/3-isopropylmalate dehydratase large subunit